MKTQREKISLEEEIKREEEKKNLALKLKPKTKNLMPKELVEFTNLLTAKCTKCEGKIIRTAHLLNIHGLAIPDPIEMWNILEEINSVKTRMVNGKKKVTINRKKTITERALAVQNCINQVKLFLEQNKFDHK